MPLNNLYGNPLFNYGVGLLSQPTFGQGLLQGNQSLMQGQGSLLQNQYLQNQLNQKQTQQAAMQRLSGLLQTTGNQPLPNTEGPPTPLQAAQRDASQIPGLLFEAGMPKEALGLLLEEKDSPFAKIDPAKYTPESVARFQQTNDYGQLTTLPEPKDLKEKFNNESKLRGEFTKATKNFAEINDAFGRIKASSSNPSPAGDLSLIFNYMKMLDPESVVRESEFATAASAGSYGERIQAFVNRVLSGERLSDKMRQDFVDRSNELYNEAVKGYEKRSGEFGRLAKRQGLDKENVLFERQLYPLVQTDPRPPLSDFE